MKRIESIIRLLSRSASSFLSLHSNTTRQFNQKISHDLNKIFIEHDGYANISKETISFVIPFESNHPKIEIYENNNLLRTITIDPLTRNPQLSGQFLHATVNILSNSAFMMDGIVSSSKEVCPEMKDRNVEAIRFQPFILEKEMNKELIGGGLFERGLHFAGFVTPGSFRSVCSCDHCCESFTLEHFHSGFMMEDYFYSKDGKETLLVPVGTFGNIPFKEFDRKLEESGYGNFGYYNSLRCPHCSAPFIDFEKFKEQRIYEYYGNVHLNTKTIHWKKQN